MRHTHHPLWSLPVAIVVAACVGSLTGCEPSTPATEAKADDHGHDHGHEHDHDHGGRPKSLHAAVASLEQMHEAISTAIKAGKPDDAHDPLHEIPALLEAIPDIAAETDLPKEDWEAVDAAHEQLFDAYTAIDKTFHMKDGDQLAAYNDVAADIEEAMEAIRSRLSLTGEDPEEDAHDHAGDDHDDHDHGDHNHGGHDHDDHDHAAEAADGHEGHDHGEAAE